jgi:hypothetical protein
MGARGEGVWASLVQDIATLRIGYLVLSFSTLKGVLDLQAAPQGSRCLEVVRYGAGTPTSLARSIAHPL